MLLYLAETKYCLLQQEPNTGRLQLKTIHLVDVQSYHTTEKIDL